MGLDASFLQMLEGRPSWERYTGDDAWGNNLYAAPVVVEAFVGTLKKQPGQQDGQGSQDAEEVGSVDLLTDFRGVGSKDRFTLQTGVVVHVESVDTVHDALGAPLFHQITATTTERG